VSKLQLLLLGHFECLLPSGERLTLSMRKAEMLLAFLALAPGIRHPRERLINLLWSDRGEEQARNSLRQCLSAIKKSLGDVADLVLQVDRTSVSLKPEMIDIDALEFERLATLAEFESLSDAAALYRGEFLEGISIRDAASQEWLESERSRFKRQFIELLTQLGQTQLISHDFSAAIKSAERLVAEDALGESGWRLLMRAYSENGDRSHALQAFKRCQYALHSELEVEPETATLELREQIAASQLPPAQAPVHDITAAPTETATPPATDNRETPGLASQATSHSIAVLPFDNLSGDPEQEYFSDGITDSIILNLSLFPGLQVKSRHSSFAFKQQIKSPGEISAELDVDYLVEGSIRKSSDRIRITVQLIEAASGNQVWGNRYDADLENLFDLEEELSRTIAATVTGQIESDLRRIAIGKSAEDQQSYDLLLAGKYHANRYNRQDNLIAIDKLNQCIQQDPDNVHAHTQLGACHGMDYLDRWTLDYRKSFELAKWHIEKAMALNPELEQVRSNYAEFLVFSGDLDEAGRQIDKVLQINPNNPETLAVKAVILIVQEDFEAGLQVAKRTLQLDPYHPWVEWELAGAQYWSGRYEAALETISAMRTDPGFTYFYAAASHAKLGHEETARKLLQEFLRGCEESMLSMPRTREEWLDYCQSGYRFKDLKWHQDMVDCLVEVGLLDTEDSSTEPPLADSHNIAVLPFDNLSGDPGQEYFSDGISESIILHLNRFPGLIVKSRNSSFAFKQQIKSLGEISDELGVDYLVEGSLRKSKDQVRITVQLVEAASGNQVWGKRYDAPLDDLFDLEEELSRTIAATVTGQIESELQRIALAKGAAGQQAYDLLLSGIYHSYRFNPRDNVIAIDKLDQCLAQDPDNVRAHAYVYVCHSMNYVCRWTADYRASFDLARTHIEKALQLAPELGLVQTFYAEYLSFCGKPAEAHRHLDKALEINPNDTDALAIRANCLGLQGDFEASLKLAEQVYRMDPYHPWAEWEMSSGQYHSGAYESTLETIARFRTDPGFTYIWIIASHVKLGNTDAARKALQDFLQACREDMLSMPQSLEDWLHYVHSSYPYDDKQYSRDLVDCLVQAGLEEFLDDSQKPAVESSHSIAVLPFDNLSGDPAQEYFSDGISESIILHLSLFPGLTVKSRNSSFAFKQQIKSLGEISAELDVAYLVEGSLRKSADQIRITVQLIEAASGNQIWGKRYDAPLADLFNVEEELSRSIAATVTGQIESDLQRIALAKGASDQQAYDLLLAGIYHANRSNREDIAKAIDKLNQCLALDPDCVRAHATIYQCHIMNWMDRLVEEYPASFELASKHAQKALALDPDSGEAQYTYGEYLMFCHEDVKAVPYLERAIASNPNNPTYLTAKAMLHSIQGDFEAAIDLAERACQLDPYNWWVDWNLAEAHYLCGHYQETIDTIGRSKNAPGFIRIYGVAANVKLERLDVARQSLQEYLQSCRESMRAMPRTLDDWLQYTVDTAPFADPGINRGIVDCLVQAGLTDDSESDSATTAIDSHTIAVLPFDNLSGDPAQEYFSDGITESIILHLNQFPELAVKSRNSSFAFKQQIKSLGEISEELGVAYLVEGSIRKSAEQIRVTVQLVEAASGIQVWGKRYDAPLDNLFSLEEELSRAIAATVTGQIESDLQRIALAKGASDQKAYDLLLSGIYHNQRYTREDTVIAIDKLTKCLQKDPDNVMAHVWLYVSHLMDYLDRWSHDHLDSFELAAQHIRKAMALAPEDTQVQIFHAQYLVFCGDFEEATKRLDKLLIKHPDNPTVLTTMALNLGLQAKAGDALEFAERACELDPYHPWAEWEVVGSQYISGQYEEVLQTIEKLRTTPGFIQIFGIAANVKLDRESQAQRALQSFLDKCRETMHSLPRSVDEWLAYTRENYPYADPEINQGIVDCLVQAGLKDEVAGPGEPGEYPSIVVLPFKNMSGDPEQEYFSDGITSSLILNLGMFKGMNVRSQASSFAFRQSDRPLGDIARELAADFLIEGSIRKSGSKIRLAVQLIESETDTQIWGKQYDRELEDILELEQDLSQALAATISGRLGHRIQQSAARKPACDLKSFDHLMRGLYHFGKFTAKDMRIAREEIEKCIAGDPENVQAHANLAEAYVLDLLENWAEDRPLAEARAREHFDIALELDPDNALAHAYLADFLNVMKDCENAQFHAERAIEINPNSSEGHAALADLLSGAGRHDEAIREADICVQLDPYSVGTNWVAGLVYRNAERYQEAIKILRRIPHPPPTISIITASCFIGMELIEEGRAEVRRYLKAARQQMIRLPDSTEAWREHLLPTSSFFRQEDEFEKLFQQLLEAGLYDESTDEEPAVPSIAVLPFENLSGDPEQAFFADGITTDIISTLSKFRHLRIVARHSTDIYRERKVSIAEIASEQNVRYLLEGSVRKSGDKIRVNAELIDTNSEQNIWSERYDRDLDDIFAVQDEITQKITLAMKVQLDDGDMALQRSAGTTNLKAWELTLTAVDLADTYIRQNILDARVMAKQALELDPDYSYAWVILAWTYWQEIYSGGEPWEEILAEAEKAVQCALDMNSGDAAALNQSAFNYLMHHDAAKALEYCRKSVELEPGNSEFQGLMAFTYIFTGNFELARVHEQNMRGLCPVMPNWYYLLGGSIEQYDGDLDQAIAIYRQGLAVEPDSPLCRFYLIHALMQRGDVAAAQILADEIRALDTGVNGNGLVRTLSLDVAMRDAFHASLETFGLV
jgi:TolB-like protein/lipoprotein NlpI